MVILMLRQSHSLTIFTSGFHLSLEIVSKKLLVVKISARKLRHDKSCTLVFLLIAMLDVVLVVTASRKVVKVFETDVCVCAIKSVSMMKSVLSCKSSTSSGCKSIASSDR